MTEELPPAAGIRKRRYTKMHRFILGITDPKVFVDHINGDGLDNRRSNLRIVTQTQNNANSRKRKLKSSRFKGVHLRRYRTRECWVATLRCNGETHYAGQFATEREAATAYNKLARRVFGEFAHLNDVSEAG